MNKTLLNQLLAFLAILPRVMKEAESKKAALNLMKNSHFDRTVWAETTWINSDAHSETSQLPVRNAENGICQTVYHRKVEVKQLHWSSRDKNVHQTRYWVCSVDEKVKVPCLLGPEPSAVTKDILSWKTALSNDRELQLQTWVSLTSKVRLERQIYFSRLFSN